MSFFRVDPRVFLFDEERNRAIMSLRLYNECFTGAFFEVFASKSDPNVIDAYDAVAVSMLSVNVPPRAAIDIATKHKQEIRALLEAIPDADIWKRGRIDEGDAEYRLWRLLRDLEGMGRTITSKLMAAKRPNLVPIFDRHVSQALFTDLREDDWRGWGEYLAENPESIETVMEVGHESNVAWRSGRFPSVLRLFDIIVWTRVWGWSTTSGPTRAQFLDAGFGEALREAH